jgi:hypothetical protein
MNWLARALNRVRKSVRPQTRATSFRQRPLLVLLEDRTVPSTASSIAADFNSAAIPGGNTLWFSATLKASGLPKAAAATVHVENGVIDFTAGGTEYKVAVPDGVVVFTPGAKSAPTTFDPGANAWDGSVPSEVTGDVFLTGVALPVTGKLPSNIKNVTWSGDFWSDTAGVSVSWSWAAAVYSSFGTDYSTLGVKTVGDPSMTKGGEHSGTPEAFKFAVIAGGTGFGSPNYTGDFTPATVVDLSVDPGPPDYPYVSSNPLTSVPFNDGAVVRAGTLDTVNGYFQLWYNGDHALALGVRQVAVTTADGTTTTDYPVSELNASPGSASNPVLGTTDTTGDQAGTDPDGRPVAPSLYITDVTSDPTSRSGDWQWGGTSYAPNDVFGTWTSVVRGVDQTTPKTAVTLTCDADPVANNWDLSPGADAVPAGLTNAGYGAEVRWNLANLVSQGVLEAGHTYRFYVIVHDGNPNQFGSDTVQASFTFYYPGLTLARPITLSGHVVQDNSDFGLPTSGLGGVTVSLYSPQGFIVETTTTLDDGSYSFGTSGTILRAGTYVIVQTTPPDNYVENVSVGQVNGVPDGVVDLAQSIVTVQVSGGDVGVNYDFLDGYNGGGGS